MSLAVVESARGCSVVQKEAKGDNLMRLQLKLRMDLKRPGNHLLIEQRRERITDCEGHYTRKSHQCKSLRRLRIRVRRG